MSGNSTKVISLPAVAPASVTARARSLVYGDPLSDHLLQRVEQIGPTEATVLLIGETGTGKELIARHIHACSKRRGPFVAVNCGALSSTLIDAELFGHESGAFTGASQARAGWFEEAHGGTLFLDEIGDMPLSLQIKLLRVLQERQVVRIGARQPIAIDIRLVAATHVDLAKAVQAGRFRADLFYRLHVAALHIAPLRERPGDIRPLLRHFLELYRNKQGRPTLTLAAAAEQALLNHTWPGNIRELENVIHFATILAPKDVIEREHLRLPQIRTPRPGPGAALPDSFSAIRNSVWQLLERSHPALDGALEEVIVRSVLEYCKGNQVRAAKALGISRNVLRARLKRCGLLGERLILPME
jgi:sigma-54 dependent transcriptional regulator